MRLIDADAMIEDLNNQMKTATNPFFAMFCDNCIAHLEKRPTVFDVEAKVAEIEKVAFERFGNDGMGGQKVVALDDAISIVRGKE